MKRQPSRPGLSYYDANSNRLVSEGPDVLNVKREIETRWPGVLEVWFDTFEEVWIVVEKCKDGTDRFVAKTKQLNMHFVHKLERIDAAKHPQPDIHRKLELEDEQAEKESGHRMSETMGEAHERFEHALRGVVLPFNRYIFNNGKMSTAGAATRMMRNR